MCEQEQYILNLIGFELDCYPVFMDIIEIFMAQGILFTSDHVMNGEQVTRIVANQECTKLVERYVDFFMFLSLQDHKLVNTNQYLIACSITSASRNHCKLHPVWPQELVQLTGLQHTHFCNIERRLLAKFEQQYQNNLVQ